MAKRYRLIKPFAYIKYHDPVAGGVVSRGFYEGAVVPETIDPGSLEHHLSIGFLEEIPDAEVPEEPPPATAPASTLQTAPGVTPPADDAPHQDWVTFASNYPDPDKRVTREAAETMTVDEIREVVTGQAPAVQRPAGNASQEVWAAYAAAHPDPARRLPADEAAKLNRDELRDRVG